MSRQNLAAVRGAGQGRKKTLSCREQDNRGGRAGFGDFGCYVINGSIMGAITYRTKGSLFIPSPPMGERVRMRGIESLFRSH